MKSANNHRDIVDEARATAERERDVAAGWNRENKREAEKAWQRVEDAEAELKETRHHRDFWSWKYERREQECEELASSLAALELIVNQQAEDEGLWAPTAHVQTAYLQQELRKLHAAVEFNNDADEGELLKP